MINNNSTGFIGILDLPRGSAVSIDNHRIVLQRDDFVGFSNVPFVRHVNDIHLVTIRAGSIKGRDKTLSSIPVAFFFSPTIENPAFVRRFDVNTEEVSSVTVDEITTRNLVNQVRQGTMDPHRFVDINKLAHQIKEPSWNDMTSCISRTLLARRGISLADKIVPGAFSDPDDENDEITNKQINNVSSAIVDGTIVHYSPIPILESSYSQVRHTKHKGTKDFFTQLPPSVRTEFFTASKPSNHALEYVLKNEYDNNWQDLLGDVQLSYILFLYINCLPSLYHWRDLLVMLSRVDADCIFSHLDLYSGLVDILVQQLSAVHKDLFQDVELSFDNFLLPALCRLESTLSEIKVESITKSLYMLQQVISDTFSDRDIDESTQLEQRGGCIEDDMNVDEEEGVDGPVVVSNDEIEAYVARSSTRSALPASTTMTYPSSVKNAYPLLFAARLPSEDILMTCARALDVANDVSLVREAAAYLEEVEAKRLS